MEPPLYFGIAGFPVATSTLPCGKLPQDLRRATRAFRSPAQSALHGWV